MLNSLFGRKKGEKAPTTGEAIQKLRETEDMLIKKQARTALLRGCNVKTNYQGILDFWKS